MEGNEKIYVITGATSGIGFATASRLAKTGAFIVGIGHDPQRCSIAEAALQSVSEEGKVHFIIADLSLQTEIGAAVTQIKELLDREGKAGLNGLVNNAGVFQYWMTLTQEGIEMQWAVNHMAPFTLTNQLLPLLQSVPGSRVVTVSSDSHYMGKLNWKDPQLRRNYNGLRAYENTKLANVLFTYELNKHLPVGSKAFAADPGLVRTEIGYKHIPAVLQWIWKVRSSAGTEPDIPARNIEYLLNEASICNSADIYWKNCHPKKPSRRALDAKEAARLWQYSKSLYVEQTSRK